KLFLSSCLQKRSEIFLEPASIPTGLFEILPRLRQSSKRGVPTMSFFQTILNSIENPNHAGTQQDLSALLSVAQALPLGQGAQHTLHPILGVLGGHLQAALSQHQQRDGQAAVQQAVTNLPQPGVGVEEIRSLLGQERFDGLIMKYRNGRV